MTVPPDSDSSTTSVVSIVEFRAAAIERFMAAGQRREALEELYAMRDFLRFVDRDLPGIQDRRYEVQKLIRQLEFSATPIRSRSRFLRLGLIVLAALIGGLIYQQRTAYGQYNNHANQVVKALRAVAAAWTGPHRVEALTATEACVNNFRFRYGGTRYSKYQSYRVLAAVWPICDAMRAACNVTPPPRPASTPAGAAARKAPPPNSKSPAGVKTTAGPAAPAVTVDKAPSRSSPFQGNILERLHDMDGALQIVDMALLRGE